MEENDQRTCSLESEGSVVLNGFGPQKIRVVGGQLCGNVAVLVTRQSHLECGEGGTGVLTGLLFRALSPFGLRDAPVEFLDPEPLPAPSDGRTEASSAGSCDARFLV